MEANKNHAQAVTRTPTNNFALWFGILGGGVAWLVHLQMSFMLTYWYCARHHSWPLHVVTVALLTVTLIAVIVSAWHWRRSPKDTLYLESGPDRPRFMAVLGFMSSVLFFLVILAQWLPMFILDPCQN